MGAISQCVAQLQITKPLPILPVFKAPPPPSSGPQVGDEHHEEEGDEHHKEEGDEEEDQGEEG